MTHSDEKEPKNAGQRMIENFLRGIPDEARLPDNDTPDPLEGTSRESAYLNDEGMLVMRYWSQKDYVVADGWDHVLPGESHYAELCDKHGLKKPGDSNQIFMRFIDGECVEVDEKQEQENKKAESDSQSQS